MSTGDILRLSKNTRLPHLSSEQEEYIFIWSNMSDGIRPFVVTVVISSQLQRLDVEITWDDKRKEQRRLKHTFGFTSLFAIYAALPNVFYAKLTSFLYQFLSRDMR